MYIYFPSDSAGVGLLLRLLEEGTPSQLRTVSEEERRLWGYSSSEIKHTCTHTHTHTHTHSDTHITWLAASPRKRETARSLTYPQREQTQTEEDKRRSEPCWSSDRTLTHTHSQEVCVVQRCMQRSLNIQPDAEIGCRDLASETND